MARIRLQIWDLMNNNIWFLNFPEPSTSFNIFPHIFFWILTFTNNP